MNTDTLTHPTVKAAIDALQAGNKVDWAALFVERAELFDDGHPRDLHKFTSEALGQERFTSIDTVDSGGLALTGHFHSDRWGDFRTYFRFQLDAAGKITRLDIGQAG